MTRHELPVPPAMQRISWLGAFWYARNRRNTGGQWNPLDDPHSAIHAQSSALSPATIRIGRVDDVDTDQALPYTIDLATHTFHGRYVTSHRQIPSRLLQATLGAMDNHTQTYPVEVSSLPNYPARWQLWTIGEHDDEWIRWDGPGPYSVNNGDSVAVVMAHGNERRPTVAMTFHLPTRARERIPTEVPDGPWDLYRRLIFDARDWRTPTSNQSALGRRDLRDRTGPISAAEWRNSVLTLDALVMAAAAIKFAVMSWPTAFSEHVDGVVNGAKNLYRFEKIHKTLTNSTTAYNPDADLVAVNANNTGWIELQFPANHPHETDNTRTRAFRLDRAYDVMAWEGPNSEFLRHNIFLNPDVTGSGGEDVVERLAKELTSLGVITEQMQDDMHHYILWLEDRRNERLTTLPPHESEKS